MIIGGAQENTLLTVEDHHADGDEVILISGPTTGPEGSLEDRIRSGGFSFEVIPELVRSIQPWTDWNAYRILCRRLKVLAPDIVHTHSSKAGIIGRAAARRYGIPAVHTIHGASFHYGQSQVASKAYQFLEKQAARSTAKFISVADDMTDEYVRAGIAPREKFRTIYSGFDIEPFLNPPGDREALREQMGFRPDDVVIGKIGRLFPLKGHEFLLAAAPMVAAADPRVKFLIVGDGVLREQFTSQIKAAGLEDRFHFTGLVPPGQIPELMSAMDIVVHTSQWEGLARVLPQGLISGKPVVSYDVGGAREVVIPGETGFLLPRDSIQPLSEALKELVKDPELRRRMGETGRARFQDQFRHQTMSRRIREVYEEVLAESGSEPDRVSEANPSTRTAS